MKENISYPIQLFVQICVGLWLWWGGLFSLYDLSGGIIFWDELPSYASIPTILVLVVQIISIASVGIGMGKLYSHYSCMNTGICHLIFCGCLTSLLWAFSINVTIAICGIGLILESWALSRDIIHFVQKIDLNSHNITNPIALSTGIVFGAIMGFMSPLLRFRGSFWSMSWMIVGVLVLYILLLIPKLTVKSDTYTGGISDSKQLTDKILENSQELSKISSLQTIYSFLFLFIAILLLFGIYPLQLIATYGSIPSLFAYETAGIVLIFFGVSLGASLFITIRFSSRNLNYIISFYAIIMPILAILAINGIFNINNPIFLTILIFGMIPGHIMLVSLLVTQLATNPRLLGIFQSRSARSKRYALVGIVCFNLLLIFGVLALNLGGNLQNLIIITGIPLILGGCVNLINFFAIKPPNTENHAFIGGVHQ